MASSVANAPDAIDLLAVLAVFALCLLARQILLRWHRWPAVLEGPPAWRAAATAPPRLIGVRRPVLVFQVPQRRRSVPAAAQAGPGRLSLGSVPKSRRQ